LPLAVLEAMAAGLPVVATAVGGVPEAITSGRDGVLVAPGDAPALADAVASLVADPARAAALGRAARARVEAEFTAARMVERWGDLLYRVATGRRTPSA
jgi:glycosyltransferase involved in cell wall biosynthesis